MPPPTLNILNCYGILFTDSVNLNIINTNTNISVTREISDPELFYYINGIYPHTNVISTLSSVINNCLISITYYNNLNFTFIDRVYGFNNRITDTTSTINNVTINLAGYISPHIPTPPPPNTFICSLYLQSSGPNFNNIMCINEISNELGAIKPALYKNSTLYDGPLTYTSVQVINGP